MAKGNILNPMTGVKAVGSKLGLPGMGGDNNQPQAPQAPQGGGGSPLGQMAQAGAGAAGMGGGGNSQIRNNLRDMYNGSIFDPNMHRHGGPQRPTTIGGGRMNDGSMPNTMNGGQTPPNMGDAGPNLGKGGDPYWSQQAVLQREGPGATGVMGPIGMGGNGDMIQPHVIRDNNGRMDASTWGAGGGMRPDVMPRIKYPGQGGNFNEMPQVGGGGGGMLGGMFGSLPGLGGNFDPSQFAHTLGGMMGGGGGYKPPQRGDMVSNGWGGKKPYDPNSQAIN